MQIVNMHEAKTHLSRLVDAAVQGEPFVITKAGKPLVKVVALESPEPDVIRCTGYRPDIQVPADFDRMGDSEVEALFEGGK